MIISHRYKFLFIGLPFSASSAISKELHLKYDGEPFLNKHSLYQDFIKVATAEEREYFVFGVSRNPMQIAVTVYEKMKANTKGNFTNPELFLENGGHITKKHREMFNFIHFNLATFQQYFNKFFKKPYDNLASLTISNCDYVIRYENIADDYLTALKKVGIKKPAPLPFANKTDGKKSDILEYYTNDIKDRAIFIFGPFLKKHNFLFPEDWGEVKLSVKSRVQFWSLGFLRKLNQKYIKKNTKKFVSEGTIYGDMQRNKLKDS